MRRLYHGAAATVSLMGEPCCYPFVSAPLRLGWNNQRGHHPAVEGITARRPFDLSEVWYLYRTRRGITPPSGGEVLVSKLFFFLIDPSLGGGTCT